MPAGRIQVWASETGYEGDPGDREELSREGTWYYVFTPNQSLDFVLAPRQIISTGDVISATTSRDPTATACNDDVFPTMYACQRFIFDAPADGTLTARVTWNTGQTGLWIVLQGGPTGFPVVSPQGASPLTASASVRAGQRYHVEVWDASAGHTFELTTSLQP